MANKTKAKSTSKPTQRKLQSMPKQGKKRSKGVLGALGGLAGGALGGPVGAALGGLAGDLVSTITGFGDYKVNQNTIVTGNSVPTFKESSDGFHVAHSEYLVDLPGSVGFTMQQVLPINPGLQGTFPLLALMSQAFEEYEMKGLVFMFRPSSGMAVASTNSALGVVIIATDYDVSNPNFSSKQAMESYEFSSSTVPFKEIIHPVECARKANVLDNLYIRTGAVPAGFDARLYDMGKTEIATQGQQSTNIIGEIWVSYDVVFRKPRIPQTPSFIYYAHITEGPNGTAAAGSPLGSTGGQIIGSSNFVGVVPIADQQSILLSNPGFYWVNASFSGGTISSVPTVVLGANVVTSNCLFFKHLGVSSVSAFQSNMSMVSMGLQVTTGGQTSANYFKFTNVGGLTSGVADVFVFPALTQSLFIPEPAPAVPAVFHPLGSDDDVKCDDFVSLFRSAGKIGLR